MKVIMKGNGVVALLALLASASTTRPVKHSTGLYEEAVNNMGDNKTFNVALATLLSGDAEGASQVVDASNTSDDAMSYYLKAIIGARTNNSSMLLDNLKIAFEKDASLRQTKRQRVFQFLKMQIF